MKPTITIGHFPIIDHLILGVAAQNDGQYLENINLKTRRFQNWPLMEKALFDKKIEGAFLFFPLAIELFRTGTDIKIVLLGQREGQVLVVNNEIKGIKDLKDKTIMLPNKFSVHNILLHQILKENGLDPQKDVHYHFGFNNIQEFPRYLKDNKIQAFVSAEPLGTLVRRMKTGKIMVTSHDIKTHHICCVLALRGDVINKYPAACQELVESLVRAGMFISAYPHQTAAIGEAFMEVSRDVALEALTHNRGHVLFWDLLPRVEDLEELENFAISEMNLWKKPVNLKKLLCADFAQNAYREWVVGTRQEIKDKGAARTLPGNFLESQKRFQSFFAGPIPVMGLKLVTAGEKFPKGATKTTRLLGGSLPRRQAGVEEAENKNIGINFLEYVFKEKEVLINDPTWSAKALYFFPSARGLEPDRVLLKLNENQARTCARALRFGEDVFAGKDINNEHAINELFTGKEMVMSKKGKDIWCSLPYAQFRFLGLLLYYFL